MFADDSLKTIFADSRSDLIIGVEPIEIMGFSFSDVSVSFT